MTIPTWTTPAGQIAIAVENQVFAFSLAYISSVNANLSIIAGSLPSGLIMDSFGNINGTVNAIPVQTNYSFTVRMTDGIYFSDRTFSILVQDIAPSWIGSDPINLGTYQPNTPFFNAFSINDPGATSIKFEKISGSLPSGLSLNQFGQIDGVFQEVDSNTTYSFTVRALLDSTKYLDKDIEITVNSTANSSPIWLDPEEIDTSGNNIFKLPNAYSTDFYNQQIYAVSPLGNGISYSATLPTGLSGLVLDPTTGVISGTLLSNSHSANQFTVTATDTSTLLSTTKMFSINANQKVVYPIEWITPAGSLGEINEGAKSIFKVKADSTSPWIRYVIWDSFINQEILPTDVNYPLPKGLILNNVTGEIWGMAQQDSTLVAGSKTFNFVVKAYNESLEVFQSFSIKLFDTLDFGATRVYATIYGPDRLMFTDLFTSPDILESSLFREGDSQFGLIEKPRILIVENLANPSPNLLATTLAGVRRTYLNLGHVEVAQAVVDQEVVYEVLYRRIFDDSVGAGLVETNTYQNNAGAYLTGQSVKPGSITNIRQRLLALGSSKDIDSLPIWMTSEQTIGDATTITGYLPVIEFAYIKPGLAQSIADKINLNDKQLKKSYLQRIRIDRIIMEPTADFSFEPQYILFDNQF